MTTPIVASPEQTPKPPLFRLPTEDARAFLNSLTEREARSMLFQLLGSSEDAWIRAMRQIKRDRAALAADSEQSEGSAA